MWSYSEIVYHVVALALFVNGFFFFFENCIICKCSWSVKVTNKGNESSCDTIMSSFVVIKVMVAKELDN